MVSIVAMLAVFAFADSAPSKDPELPSEDASLVSGAIFEVIAANGKRRASGKDELDFEQAVENYYDGDTVVLLGDIRIEPRDEDGNIVEDTTIRTSPDKSPCYRWASLNIYTAQEKTLNIDLNGYGIILRDDDFEDNTIGRGSSNVFEIDGRAVINMYSSRQGGHIFTSSSKPDPDNFYYTGGFIFHMNGNSTLNLGRFEKADGTVVPGYHLSTSGAGFVNMNVGAPTVNIDGGTYYRYSTQSQVGIIAQRETSEGTIISKNANIISHSKDGTMMLRGVKSTTIFENCLIYDINSDVATQYRMVANQGGGVGGKEYYRFTGTLIMKDCVTSYNLSAVSLYPSDSEGEIGRFYLEGENVFRKEALNDEFNESYEIYKNGYNHYQQGHVTVYSGFYDSGKILARVSRRYAVEGNPIYYTPGYKDAEYGYSSITDHVTTPKLAQANESFDGYAFIDAEDAVKYKFVNSSGYSTEYYWKNGDTILPPTSSDYAFPKDTVEGVFNYAWKYTKQKDGSYVAEIRPNAQYSIKVSYDMYVDFALNVYIQKDVFESYVDPINCYIGDTVLTAKSGKEVTLKENGKDVVYYKFTKSGISADELLESITVQFPISFYSQTHEKRIEGDGSWDIDILKYCDAIRADNSGCSDDERAMANNLLYYVKKYYSANVDNDDWNETLYLALSEKIDEDSLLLESADYKAVLNKEGIPAGVLWEAPKTYGADLSKAFYAYAYSVFKAYSE